MGINRQKIKKWTNMLLGKSAYHVNQDEGRIYSKTDVKGYYNNLTEKITRFGLENDDVPTTTVDTGETIYFSIAIFQYGLAAYDLYLLKNDNSMLNKVFSCANWAVENQNEDGSWATFKYENPKHPNSSMAQGEGISLLIRAYNESKNDKYLKALKKAYKYMIIPIEKGGTTKYYNDEIYFYECIDEPLILNGWIFSLWGIYDYQKFIKDKKSKELLDKTINTLVKKLPDFDIKYWSKYEDGKRICSPFYHELHISQLKVMYDLTGIDDFKIYANKWEKYNNNKFYKFRAFIKKASQKIFEK